MGSYNAQAGKQIDLNLPKRERDALLQSSGSKTPQEYSTLVQRFRARLSEMRSKR